MKSYEVEIRQHARKVFEVQRSPRTDVIRIAGSLKKQDQMPNYVIGIAFSMKHAAGGWLSKLAIGTME